jgi:hypothetical protein
MWAIKKIVVQIASLIKEKTNKEFLNALKINS